MQFTKDPNEILDYGIDWSSWLPSGETIASTTWLTPEPVTSSPLEIVAGSDSFDGTSTLVHLQGGLLGEIYSVTNRITLADGRQTDRTFNIQVVTK